MERVSRFRAMIILLIFLLVVGFFSFWLYKVQIIDTGGKTDNSTTFTTLTRVKAARGDILDKNGNVLVSNRASYDLVINHYVLLSATGTTDHLYNLVKRCQEVGITYNEHFPISMERPFTYTTENLNSAYQRYFQEFLAYKGGLDSDITAPVLVQKLRERYELPEEWSDEDARLVIGMYYELDLRGCSGLPNFTVVSDANDDELSAIVELNIPGMNVEASTVREYNTTYGAHILGYVGAMSPKQWEYYEKIEGYAMDAEVGQDGLEAAYEEYLHGVDGWREDTVALDGTLVSSRYLSEPKAGSNVEISIDLNVQMAAEDALAACVENLKNQKPYADGSLPDGLDVQGAAAVAINVKTGQVLACASYPTYDLSRFFEDYETISTAEYDPLFNRALQGTYPPGSTYKMVMVTAAMENAIIDANTTIYDAGRFTKYGNGFAPTCLAYAYGGGGHGTINASQALMCSCNYFFYELADRMHINQIDHYAKGFGLGEPTGVELPESIGHRANAQTKKELYDEGYDGWYGGDQVLAAIGQSDNRFTPMQLCVYASTLANQGNRYKATFMSRVVSADYRKLLASNEKTLVSTVNISNETYNTYLKGMIDVTTGPSGTATSSFRGFAIPTAAKTGTSEHDITGASDHASFVCFAPADDPQIAISVYLERGGHGYSGSVVAQAMIKAYLTGDDEVGDVLTYENRVS